MKKLVGFLHSNKEKIKMCLVRVLFIVLILYLITIFILGTTCGFNFLYNLTDTTKATDEDYEPLYKQAEAIKNDFGSIFSMKNASAAVEEEIVIILESEECNLQVKLNRNRTEILEIKEYDKSSPIELAVSLCIIFGVIIGCISSFIGMAVVWCIYQMYKYIRKTYKKKK